MGTNMDFSTQQPIVTRSATTGCLIDTIEKIKREYMGQLKIDRLRGEALPASRSPALVRKGDELKDFRMRISALETPGSDKTSVPRGQGLPLAIARGLSCWGSGVV